MAATTAGAVKAYLEAQSLGVAVFRGQAPAGQAMPYVTVDEGVSIVPDLSGDFGSANPITGRETADVHVWQAERTGLTGESYTLAPAVRRAMHGANLTASPTKVYGVRVVGGQRLTEPDNDLVHDVVTVEISRAL